MFYRDIYEEPIIGKITQGSIFNGAKSRFYPGCESVHGIIISPRCDIEQKKAPLYYYLPAIKMEDWVLVDFPTLYLRALETEIKGTLRTVLKENHESDTILDRFSPAEVEKILKKHQKQLKQKIAERIELWKAIESYKKGGALRTITSIDNTSVRKSIFDEIIAHKNPNYYFLESESEGGFVLRMREISRITPEMLFKLANGIEGHLSEGELEDNDLRQLNEGEIFMPLHVVKSPYIEHVMQHFLQQFNRIGIADVPKEFSDSFSSLL